MMQSFFLHKRADVNSRGFTLVELAIVLVIMGLLAAAAVGGRELIKSAEIRGVISELETYKIAVDNFEMQYEGLPGDLVNATSFFGAAADCVAPYTAEAGKTCNGNGDGDIGNGTNGDDTEPYTVWDQLSMAKMIPGSYSGAGTSGVVGVNSPESKHFDATGYSLRYFIGPWSYADAAGRLLSFNYIIFGKNHASANYLDGASLTPEGAYMLDSKIDNGLPNYGKVLAGTSSSFASGVCSAGAAYTLTNNGVACLVFFSIANE